MQARRGGCGGGGGGAGVRRWLLLRRSHCVSTLHLSGGASLSDTGIYTCTHVYSCVRSRPSVRPSVRPFVPACVGIGWLVGSRAHRHARARAAKLNDNLARREHLLRGTMQEQEKQVRLRCLHTHVQAPCLKPGGGVRAWPHNSSLACRSLRRPYDEPRRRRTDCVAGGDWECAAAVRTTDGGRSAPGGPRRRAHRHCTEVAP